MNRVSLIEKVLKIERANGDEEPVTLGVMVYEAAECALRMQQEFIYGQNSRAGFIEEHRPLRI
jgi:hypothetical protein